MTIEEFMCDIAPKMRPGWVAMDKNGEWFWFNKKPLKLSWGFYTKSGIQTQIEFFNIEPVNDWQKSLKKVGN